MAAVEVDKVADMVADMLADKKNMADMELVMVAHMEVDKNPLDMAANMVVAMEVDKVADMVADMELDMVANIEVDKVADMVADNKKINIDINVEIQFGERIGHEGGWLIGPKLFRSEAYPSVMMMLMSMMATMISGNY